MQNYLKDIKARGLLKQVAYEEELDEHLKKARTAYIGFDPTASSLHCGSLMQIISLVRWQQAGGKAIFLMGGGTGYIGDPTGKSELRNFLNKDNIYKNVEAIQKQISNWVDLDAKKGVILNNLDWLKELNYLEFIRDMGPHFNVNRMLGAECYKQRMEAGLSFLEFNYMILQSYDFYHLNKNHDCTVQLGGDDQWSNMLGGVSLVRKISRSKVFCLTSPLLLTSDGKKMGKTESGAVWLDPNLTSPYDFFQYWRNVADSDVSNCLRHLTFLPMDEIKNLESLKDEKINQAKEVLAFEVTKFVHGEGEAKSCLDKAKAIFSKGSIDEAPEVEVSTKEFKDGQIEFLQLMVLCKITSSKGEARRLIKQNAICINNKKITAMELKLSLDDVKSDQFVIRRGKKKFYKVKII